jgi:replicative superfamily II helicase
MELGILSLLKAYVDPATGQMGATGGATKAVYLAPLRALVQEKYKEWHDRYDW